MFLQEWIRTKDRMPEVGVDVLVTLKRRDGRAVWTTRLLLDSAGHPFWCGIPKDHEVLAWMPIPEAYDEDA